MGSMGLRSFFKIKKKKKSEPQSIPSPPPLFEDELELAFKKFDANGDGKISKSELGSILSALGHPATSSELDRMIREADADGDFLNLYTTDMDSDEMLKDAFSVFDVDKNGSISADELMQVLKGLGEDCTMLECTEMIKVVDRDGDGTINFEEFKEMMGNGMSFKVA